MVNGHLKAYRNGIKKNLKHSAHRKREKLVTFSYIWVVFVFVQVKAEIDVINGSWKPGGDSTGLADSIGQLYLSC